MKKLSLLLLITIWLHGFGFPITTPIDPIINCLEVGDSSGQECSGNEITMNDIDIDFTTTMKVGQSNLEVVSIPIYVDTDSNDKVSMIITDESDLQNSDGESIDFSMEYISKSSGSTQTISSGVAFTILDEGESGRDGDTVVGNIRIIIDSLLDTQTMGTYSFSKKVKVKLGDIEESLDADFDAKGEVEQVSVVGFSSMSSFQEGVFFVDSTVDYGDFKLNENNEKREDVFVKNNTNGEIKIKFNTSPLVHTLDNNYQIDMSYYYKANGDSEQEIENDTYFTISSGKNGGDKVGEMRFVTEPLTKALLAGEYSATLNVTVSAN